MREMILGPVVYFRRDDGLGSVLTLMEVKSVFQSIGSCTLCPGVAGPWGLGGHMRRGSKLQGSREGRGGTCDHRVEGGGGKWKRGW